jgi:hypothetical protein
MRLAPGEQVDCTMGGCGGLDAGHNGYGDDLDCSKTIMAPASHTVNLIFTHCPGPLGAVKRP